MVPTRPHTLRELRWKLSESYFKIESFHDLVIFVGLLAHRICQYVIFFFGEKSRVYEGKPRTLEDLKLAICEKTEEIDFKFLNRADVDFRKRLQTRIRENGPHHLSDIIFHK